MATVVDASRVNPVNKGQTFNQVEQLKFLADMQKKGMVETILTHSQLDRVVTSEFSKLPKESQTLLVNAWARGRTIGGKPVDGEMARRDGNFYSFVSKEGSLSVETIVPAEAIDRYTEKDRAGRGSFWNVTGNNTEITSHSDDSVSARLLNPNDAVSPKLVKSGAAGKANESTMWIPTVDAKDGEKRYGNYPEGEAAGALGRGRSDLNGLRQDVSLGWPSSRAGVLVAEPGVVPAELKQLAADVAEIAKKPVGELTPGDWEKINTLAKAVPELAQKLVGMTDSQAKMRALAAGAEKVANQLVVTVKPEMLQPILDLINATKVQ